MRKSAFISLLVLGFAVPGCFNKASDSPDTQNPGDAAGGGEETPTEDRARGSVVSKGSEARKVVARLKAAKPARMVKVAEPDDGGSGGGDKPARATRGNVELVGFSPTIGSSGSKIEIYGTGFASEKTKNKVTVGGVGWEVEEVRSDHIVAVVPDGAKGGAVQVKVGKKKSSTDAEFALVDDDGGFGKPGPSYNGLIGEVFAAGADLDAMPDFSSLGDPIGLIAAGPIDIPAGRFEQGFSGPNGTVNTNFAVRFTGSLNVVEEAEYELCINSDDGSRLYLEDTLVVDNDHASEARETCELVYLESGEYMLRMEYFQGTDPGVALSLSWSINGAEKVVIPADALFRPENPASLMP
jgi:hypothetical protein